jgi:hypothetical protein
MNNIDPYEVLVGEMRDNGDDIISVGDAHDMIYVRSRMGCAGMKHINKMLDVFTSIMTVAGNKYDDTVVSSYYEASCVRLLLIQAWHRYLDIKTEIDEYVSKE